MAIRNTTTQDSILNVFAARLPGGIEEQEARGQAELVRSTQLPVECYGDEDTLRALGFTLGPICENDPLFREATLPEGWEKRPTSHQMHTDVVDDQGRRRAGVFYKAAFYDRKASMRLARRFSINLNAYEDIKNFDNDRNRLEIRDQDNVIYHGEWRTILPLEERDAARAEAEAWLAEHYGPDWNDPVKQWEL